LWSPNSTEDSKVLALKGIRARVLHIERGYLMALPIFRLKRDTKN